MDSERLPLKAPYCMCLYVDDYTYIFEGIYFEEYRKNAVI